MCYLKKKIKPNEATDVYDAPSGTMIINVHQPHRLDL